MEILWELRIDKYLNIIFEYDKEKIKQTLKQNKIRVNDEIIVKPNKKVTNNDKIYVENTLVLEDPFTYIMLNKPKGYISATKDANQKTILDLIENNRKDTLRIMGRLDIDTTGLVILTNDNQLIKQNTLPENHVGKKYLVTTEKEISNELVGLFLNGVIIDDGYICKAAKLDIINQFTCQLEIYEGRYHQVKKMFLSVGNKVVDLKRITIHNLKLDETLNEGESRLLTLEEIIQLKR